MADTTAALVVALDAKVNTFIKGMEKASGSFDKEGRKIAKQHADLQKRFKSGLLNASGLSSLSAGVAGLTGVAVVGGLATLVKSSLEAASAIGDTAIQAGTSVEKLQQLRFAATQSGASMADLDAGLTALNRNMGEFINTGGGKAAAAFKQLGFTRQQIAGIGDSGVMLEKIAERSKKFGTEAQRTSIYAKTMGMESGPKLKQMLDEGQAGLEKLAAQANSLGIVLSTKTVKAAKEADDKLSALSTVIKSQVVGAVSEFAPQIAGLADSITKSLPDLITWVEKWSSWFGLINLNPAQKLSIQISDLNDEITRLQDQRGSKTGLSGFLNSLLPADNGLDRRIASLKKQRDSLASQMPRYVAGGAPIKKAAAILPATADEIAVAKALEQSRKDFMDKTLVDSKTAAAAWIAAQNSAEVDRLKGLDGYHDAVMKQIEDERKARLEVIDAEQGKEMAALDKLKLDSKGAKYKAAADQVKATFAAKRGTVDVEQDAKAYAASPQGFMDRSAAGVATQIRQYWDETEALGAVGAAAVKLAYVQQKLNEANDQGIPITSALRAEIEREGDALAHAAAGHNEAAAAQERLNSLNQGVEQGLLNIGTAALHGFGSMKDAAAMALDQIAQLILQMYVLEPLLDSLKASGGKGGLVGGILSSFGGFFADGGRPPVGRPSIVGERGPELFVPNSSGTVIPNAALRRFSVPSIGSRGQPSVVVNMPPVLVNLTGANGDATIEQYARRGAEAGAKAAISNIEKRFPGLMRKAQRDFM